VARRALRASLLCLTAVVLATPIAGCSSGSGGSSKAAEPNAANIVHNEETAERKQEAAEIAQDRELLSGIEAKKREEAAEERAKRTEAIAAARAKKREEDAAKAAKRKEEAAEENVRKREEASKAEAKAGKEARRKRAKAKSKGSGEPRASTSRLLTGRTVRRATPRGPGARASAGSRR
jgi:hypothetical protein